METTDDLAVAPLLELKFAKDAATGEFEGYGAVFGNVDTHGDTITPGAFAASITERKGRPLPMHLNHGIVDAGGRRGVGVWTALAEDTQGLHVKGKISGMQTDAGRLLYEQVRDGAFHGLSIGYHVKPGGAQYGAKSNGARRTLSALGLREVSLVDDPSNPEALIREFKSRLGCKSVSGTPDKAAAEIAAAIRLHGQAMAKGGDNPAQAAVMDHLRNAHEAMTGDRNPPGMKSAPTRADLKAALLTIPGMTEEMAETALATERKSAPHPASLSDAFTGFGTLKLS